MKQTRRFRITPEGHLVISQRGRWEWLSSLIALCVLGGAIGLVIGLLVLAIMATAAEAATCRDKPERTGAWGWRMIDDRKCWYEGRKVILKEQLHWPQQIAADMGSKPEKQSWLERASDNATPAEIYFLSTVNGRGSILEAYPMLIWRQPWLSPESVMRWPLLLDVDRLPFGAWNKRIGQ